jgi:hypothetical protein
MVKTRKNKNFVLQNNVLQNIVLQNSDTHNHDDCIKYSEGFRRRMTDDITLVSYTPPPEELARINEISKKLIKPRNPQLDKECQEYIKNYPKYRAEYLESVKNGTNKY